MKTIIGQALLSAILVLAPAAAHAAPTYLTCSVQFPGSSTPVDMRFALDEATQSVAITSPTDKASTAPAVFAASSVSFSDGFLTWEIDRTSLEAKAQATMRGQLIGPQLNATCRMEEAPKRVF